MRRPSANSQRLPRIHWILIAALAAASVLVLLFHSTPTISAQAGTPSSTISNRRTSQNTRR